MALGHGGAREGTGGHHVLTPERAAARDLFEVERARHERIKRLQREFDFAQRRQQYLPREAQRAAAATVLAILEHSLRPLPARMGLPGDATEAVAAQIDDALASVAAAFGAMTTP